MRLGGKRRRGRRPGETVHVDARVAVVADPRKRVEIHRQLERRQLRFLADLLDRELIGGRAELIIRALGVLGERGAQEAGVRRIVRPWIGILQLEVRDDRQLVAHRSQRGEAGRQVSQHTFARRSPAGMVAPHRNEHIAEPRHRLGRCPGKRRCRGNHRVEQRQRQRGLQPPKERAPRQRLLGDDHVDVLI